MPSKNQSSFEECSEDGCSGAIVNKKYKLCQRHNWERIHGEDYYEHKRKKQKEYKRNARKKAIEKGNGLSRSKPLNRKSKKQKKVESGIRSAYEDVQRRDGFRCTGCGQSQHLSHSHLVPRSRRKDLRADPRNIFLQCVLRRDGSLGCHQRWEQFRAYELKNFEELMERLEELDETYFELYKQSMNETRTSGS